MAVRTNFLLMLITSFFSGIFISLLLLLPVDSQARKLSLIRDAEIESTIRAYADPLLTVAKLETAAVRILIVKDTGLNAFVSGGQNIFVNTGLLMKTTDASQIIGVLAHEIGHIEGGHLSRLANAKKADKEAFIGSIPGGAAAVLEIQQSELPSPQGAHILEPEAS